MPCLWGNPRYAEEVRTMLLVLVLWQGKPMLTPPLIEECTKPRNRIAKQSDGKRRVIRRTVNCSKIPICRACSALAGMTSRVITHSTRSHFCSSGRSDLGVATKEVRKHVHISLNKPSCYSIRQMTWLRLPCCAVFLPYTPLVKSDPLVWTTQNRWY